MLDINNVGIFIIFFDFVFVMLPESPFLTYQGICAGLPYLDVLAWFVPVGEIIILLEMWLTVITLYTLVSVLARWIKLVQ